LLGEIHIANKKEENTARKILPFFEVLGVEGVSRENFREMVVFSIFSRFFLYPLITIFSLGRRSMFYKSSIRYANCYPNDPNPETIKKVVKLEKGWVPNLRARLFVVFFPLYTLFVIYKIFICPSLDGTEVDISSVIIGVLFGALSGVLIIKVKILNFIIIIIFGYLFGLLFSRNEKMAENAAAVLSEDEGANNLLVLTGAAHTRGISEILQKKYGFVPSNF
jgi:hypothetical protein